LGMITSRCASTTASTFSRVSANAKGEPGGHPFGSGPPMMVSWASRPGDDGHPLWRFTLLG
jgi:hypothetical protein